MIKYKNSMYNIYLGKTVKNETIVYNSYSGAIGLFDSVGIADMENANISSKYLEDMISQGFLVYDSLNEYERVMLHHKTYIYNNFPEKMQFTIAPTLACPLSCYYCFEKNHSNYIMDKETMDKVYEYIVNMLKQNINIKRLHITWFGGEPLVGKNIIYDIGSKLYNYCKKNKIVYTAKILTNGILLDRNILEDMVNKHVITAIQFTLDGNENDYVEIKKGTTEQYKKLKKLISISPDIIETYVRLNVTNSNYHTLLKEVIDILDKRKNQNNNHLIFYAMPVIDYTNCNEKRMTEEEMNRFRAELKDILKKYNVLKRHVTSSARTTAAFCGAMRLCNLTFGPQGEMYRCENLIGDTTNIIGNVYEGRFYNKQDFQLPEGKLYEKCKECNFLPVCWAGCPVHRIVYKKDFDCNSLKQQIISGLLDKLKGGIETDEMLF